MPSLQKINKKSNLLEMPVSKGMNVFNKSSVPARLDIRSIFKLSLTIDSRVFLLLHQRTSQA